MPVTLRGLSPANGFQLNRCPRRNVLLVELKRIASIAFVVVLGMVLAGCGGSSSSSSFSGNWTGTGTITSSKGTAYNGTVTMLVDSSNSVSGTDTVTIDGGQETEAGSITSSGGSLTLVETTGTGSSATTTTSTVTATVTINSSSQMIWSGTETQNGASYTLTYTLTKGLG